MKIQQRLYSVLGLILLVVMIGSVGYYTMFAGTYAFIDCVYMTIISLTTVGFGEVIPITGNVTAEIFTMLLILFGMGIIAYGISTLTAVFVEGELSGLLRKRKMENLIKKMEGHYIVCGGGETGRPVLAELLKNQEPVVLIELDEANIERCQNLADIPYIKGDATEDENLITAGIERASGIIISLPSDKDNLYVTMSARMLNHNIRIISRMVDKQLEPKLRKAGADSVVSPNTIGALRMASEMIRPMVVDFLDSMLRSSRGDLRINQIIIGKESKLVGKKIMESGIKDKFDLLILGAKNQNKEIEFNPPPAYQLMEGMTLIVMGEVDNIVRAKKSY